jgi:hypothetical protein
MRKLLVVLVVLIAGLQWLQRERLPEAQVSNGTTHTQSAARADALPILGSLERAFANRESNVQVRGTGTVTKLLADDNDGARHQRFIVRLASGQTILIAHNIDLAPRVAPLRIGDPIEFYGEYEWNERGGVVHWTHRDPAGRHPDGWIRQGARNRR